MASHTDRDTYMLTNLLRCPQVLNILCDPESLRLNRTDETRYRLKVAGYAINPGKSSDQKNYQTQNLQYPLPHFL